MTACNSTPRQFYPIKGILGLDLWFAETSDQRSCQAVASVAVLRSYKSTITVIG
jgi:hypothetical protein